MQSLGEWAAANGVTIRERQDYVGGAEQIRYTATVFTTEISGQGASPSAALAALSAKVSGTMIQLRGDNPRIIKVPCLLPG